MALREVFARFAFAFEGANKLRAADQGVDRLAQKAKDADSSFASLGAGLLGAFAGNALLSGLNQFATQLDVLDDLSAQTKIATDDLQVYGYAAQKSGSSTEEMNASLSLLQKSLGKTTEATGAQVEALGKLQIDTSRPRELNEVLPEVFQNFNKLSSANEKAAVATSLFGRAGVRLIPLLERGSEGVAELRKELEESGGLVDAQTIARAGEYRDNLARLDRSMFALKGTIAGALFPQLSKVVEGVSKGVGALSNFAKGTTLAENAGLALAASLAGPVLGAFRPFIGRGLKFAAVFAAVDDVVGFLNGKDALIGDLLNGAFGDGTADKVRDWVNDAVGQFQYFIASADAAYATIESSQATTFQKMLAGTALLFNGSVNTFAAIGEGWESILLRMSIAIDEWVLSVSTKWNEMIQSLVGNAGPLSGVLDFLKVDDKSSSLVNEDGLAARKKRLDELQIRAYQRESGTGEFAGTSQGEEARRRYAAQAAAPSWGEMVAAGDTRTQRVNKERQDAIASAAGVTPTVVQGTLAAAGASGTTATLNDNKTVNINFAPGTSAAQKDEIKKAVAEALRTDNRNALDALTQRAKK